jgi:hypothetical protein
VLRVTVDVGAGARLEYLPEPVVVSAAARHATIIRVTLAEGASLLLRDELLLGRHGETGGAARSVLNVDYAGRPLLRQSLEVSGADAVAMGPALLAGHRAVGTALWVDPAAGETQDAGAAAVADSTAGGEPAQASRAISADAARTTDAAVAVMPLAGPGILVTALANNALALRRCLSATLELGFEGFDFAGVGAELLEGGALADAGQRPADGLGAAAGDARRDQGVQRRHVFPAEPGHHRGQLGAVGPRAAGSGATAELLDPRPRDPAWAGRLAACHELEEHRGRQLVKFAPEVMEGLAVLTVERLECLQALGLVGRRVDDQPRH